VLQLLRDQERHHCRRRHGHTADIELAEKIKMYALHGLSMDAWRRFFRRGYKHYDVRVAGFKYNMTDLQAALGIHQLARLERNTARREAIWARYNEAFEALPVVGPAPVELERSTGGISIRSS